MATQNVYDVRFRIVKLNSAAGAQPYAYVRPDRRGLVQAASMHPKDLLTTLNADVTLGTGESIEILWAGEIAGGTEGATSVMS